MAERKPKKLPSIAEHYSHVVALSRQLNPASPEKEIDINREIAREQKLKNDDTEQDIALKRQTLLRLFRFLAAETIVIFLLTFFQGIHWPFGFHLDEWSLRIVAGATIGQVATMLLVAVKYLFPRRHDKG